MTKPLTDAQRIAKLASVIGLSHQQAASRLGVSKDTVKEWRRKYPAPIADPTIPMGPPVLTPQLAQVFAQLLHAGCPQLKAVEYMAPHLSVEEMKATLKEWMAGGLIVEAVEQLQGGAWITLPAEKRYELALQKHLSEAAFFLYANNFNEVGGKESLEMFKQARELLKSELKGAVDETDPLQAFARFALEMAKAQTVTRAAESKVSVNLQPPSMDRMHEEMSRVKLPKPGEKLN